MSVALCAAGPLPAQAPAAAGLWRVATGTLARPPALESGPTGTFWNPAGEPHGRLTAGVQVVQSSDILGLGGFLAGATYRVGPIGHVGVQVGRIDVRDLVRTTTSPNSEPGGIPVFQQFAGVQLRLHGSAVALGAAFRVHDAQFDDEGEQGVTLDFGIRATPLDRLTLAAATRFLPPDLDGSASTDYYAGAEYRVVRRQVTGIGRYGVTVNASGDVGHDLGIGAMLDDAFRVDLGVAGEAGFGRREWRPALALSFRVGRYTLGVARGQGLNDVGATYRVLLDVEFTR